MTFEEIREMVSSTITENGQRQITGKALNLAFVETLTAVEEYLANNKPEGAGAETIYYEETLTEAHQAANAAVYAKCKANVAEGKPLPAILIDMTGTMAADLGTTEGIAAMTPFIQQVIFVDPSSPIVETVGISGLAIAAEAQILVNEDGTISALS